MLEKENLSPDLEDKVWTAVSRLSVHEAMCEERSKTIFHRLEAIEDHLHALSRNVFIASFALMSGMAGVIITLLLN
jgi:hypothetical protein